MTTKQFLLKFLTKNKLSELENLVCKIFFYAAPTIKNVKPASLICFKNTKSLKIKDIWLKHKEELKDTLPIMFYELKSSDDSVTVLFYNEEFLKNVLCDKDCNKFLCEKGYRNCKIVKKALENLKNKFNKSCPDEIGIFLGYPLSDVKEFLNGNKRNCKMVRYWRVYSNEEHAIKMWKKYDDARQSIVNEISNYNSPVELLVNNVI